jgi:NTE family protein
MCIGRDDFDRLLETQPGFALSLVRVLGERLSRSRPFEQPRTALKAISLVPLHDDAPVDLLANQLVEELRRFGPAVRIDELDETFTQVESANDWVLLTASSSSVEDPWTRYCLRQADRIVGVATRAHFGSATADHAKLRGCDVAFLGAPGNEPALQGWLDALDPRTTYALRTGRSDGVQRMARRLAGRAIGVVLSGGGARGIAHIGVIEELQRSGYPVDRIGSVSMGATIGSLFAEGRSADEVAEIVQAAYVHDSPLRGRTVPLVALSRGEKGLAMQFEIHADRQIEGLEIPFYCVSSDLVAQRMVVHRRGPVAMAVSASQALPAFVPPLKTGEQLLIDGAIFSNLPVEPMREMHEGPVIAVDVSGRLPLPRPPRSPLRFLRRWVAGPAGEWSPNITEIVLRSILLGNVASDAVARERADAVIQPQLQSVSTMRFRDIPGVRSLGREAVDEAIESGVLDAIAGRPGPAERAPEPSPVA